MDTIDEWTVPQSAEADSDSEHEAARYPPLVGHLIQSLEKLIADLKDGRTHVAPHVVEELASDLENVERDEDGNLVLATCSPALRSTARAYTSAIQALEQPEETSGSPAPETIVQRATLAISSTPSKSSSTVGPEGPRRRSSAAERRSRRLSDASDANSRTRSQ